MNILTNWQQLPLRVLFFMALVMAVENIQATPYLKTDSNSAVESLLLDAKTYYETQQYEQAAASLERALRIKPRNPIIWYNLAGVRLANDEWKRAANLAQKSNALAGKNKKYKNLRIRNWMVITLACEGMGNDRCAREARDRAQTLIQK